MAAKKKEIAVPRSPRSRSSRRGGRRERRLRGHPRHPKPAKQAGERVVDEGDGGTKVVEFLVSQKII